MCDIADHAEMERICGILERISRQYPSDSDESLAIRNAALAFTVVTQNALLRKAYDKLLLAFGGTLTEEMRDDLRRRGIDPDTLDDERSDEIP